MHFLKSKKKDIGLVNCLLEGERERQREKHDFSNTIKDEKEQTYEDDYELHTQTQQ